MYPNTIPEFHTRTPFIIDLRQPLSFQTREHRRVNNLDRTFAVITAYNPRGHCYSDVDNSRRAGALETHLQQRGLYVVHVDGVSPDRAHRESGDAVKVTCHDATELANLYHQSAFFWFDGEQFWIMPALFQEETIPLPQSVSKI